MKKKIAWVAVPLVALLCIGTYLFFADDPPSPDILAESESVPTDLTSSVSFPDSRSRMTTQNSSSVPTLAPDDRALERESETKGDRTRFSLTHGDIGYVDVRSIMQDRNPYSILDLLRAHEELTGADDLLEITIERISENEIWGQEVLYRQVIDGQPLRQAGTIFFSSDGTVTWMTGNLINTQSLNASDIVILAPEAEAIALQAATGYAVTVAPENPEWSDIPVTLTARSVEMGYELDADSNLIRLWRARVDIDGPAATGVVVSISPETGEVLSMRSTNVQSTTSGISLTVCDAGKINVPASECDFYSRKKGFSATHSQQWQMRRQAIVLMLRPHLHNCV